MSAALAPEQAIDFFVPWRLMCLVSNLRDLGRVGLVIVLAVGACCGPPHFPHSTSSYVFLPPAIAARLTPLRCISDAQCQAKSVLCADESSGHCAAGFCEFAASPSCACYDGQIKYCRYGNHITGATCDYGVQQCETAVSGQVAWGECTQTTDCSHHECATSSSNCPVGHQAWTNGDWSQCLQPEICAPRQCPTEILSKRVNVSSYLASHARHQTFYLNFDGLVFRNDYNEDSTHNVVSFLSFFFPTAACRSQAPPACCTVGAMLSVPAFDAKAFAAKREDVIKTIACQFRNIYSPYDVSVVTERPVTGDYTMVVFGGRPQDVCAPDEANGIAYTDPGNANPNQIAFVFAGLPFQLDELARVAAHEGGHTLGLFHIDRIADVMYPTASGTSWGKGRVIYGENGPPSTDVQDDQDLLNSVVPLEGVTAPDDCLSILSLQSVVGTPSLSGTTDTPIVNFSVDAPDGRLLEVRGAIASELARLQGARVRLRTHVAIQKGRVGFASLAESYDILDIGGGDIPQVGTVSVSSGVHFTNAALGDVVVVGHFEQDLVTRDHAKVWIVGSVDHISASPSGTTTTYYRVWRYGVLSP